MGFSVTVLGANSATPTKTRKPSAQVVTYNNKRFLVDCGEGTQMQMLKYNIKPNRINHIFISHLHGDHYLGLAGLLFTLHLFGRRKEMHIFAPPELEDIIKRHINVANTQLTYPLHFHKLTTDKQGLIFEDKDIEVKTFALKHRIPTFGFLFREKPKERKIIKAAIDEYSLSIEDIQKAKKGEAVYDKNGHLLPDHLLTQRPPSPLSYAYCSDTAYQSNLARKITGVSLLYHEATYADDMQEIAADKYHATARQAATVAKKANAKRLLIGHYSTRYKTLDKHLSEAREVFPETSLAVEGETYDVL